MKKYALWSIGILLACCVTGINYYTLCAQEGGVKKTTKKQAITSSRHRKGKAAKEVEVVEEPIANFDQYVTTFDHEAKFKAVQALIAKGVDFCAQNTLQTICDAFTHTQDFIEGALYLFLIDMNGIVYAHGDQPSLVWKNLSNRKDMFGAFIVQSMIKLAKSGGGLLTYEWDGAIKVSVIKKVVIDGKEFVVGCGYYPHSKEYAVIGLVKGAVALFNQYVAEGRDVRGAFSDMSYPKSVQFVFGDLYLYALDFEGIIVAQGDRPRLIGSPALHYADAQGKMYNKEFIDQLKKKQAGEGVWVDYISKGALKHAYAEKVTDKSGKQYFIACGYYPEVGRDDVINLVRRAYQFMKASGVDTAQKAFNDEDDKLYRNGDLAIFLYDMKGKCLAYGLNDDLVGQNHYNFKDPDGRYYVRDLIRRAQSGGGWVNFKMNNSFQSAYVEKIDMGIGEFVIGSSIFPLSKPDTMTLLVKSAISYLTDHSIDVLLERLVNRNDEFLRGDLFTYVLDVQGYCYGWGDNYNLVWQNLLNWKDQNNKQFIKSMIEISEQGPGYLVLKMNNRPRVHYFERIEKDGKKYIIGSGFYK